MWNYKLELDLNDSEQQNELCMVILVIQIGKSHLWWADNFGKQTSGIIEFMDIQRQELSWWKCNTGVVYYVFCNNRDKLNLNSIKLTGISVHKHIYVSLGWHFMILLVYRDNKVKSMIKFIIPKIMFDANIDVYNLDIQYFF